MFFSFLHSRKPALLQTFLGFPWILTVRFSSQPRYDRFDISPYMLSLKSRFDWTEQQDRTTCLFNFSNCENPHGCWIFGWTGRPVFGEISSQPRYDHFDTSPYFIFQNRLFMHFLGILLNKILTCQTKLY